MPSPCAIVTVVTASGVCVEEPPCRAPTTVLVLPGGHGSARCRVGAHRDRRADQVGDRGAVGVDEVGEKSIRRKVIFATSGHCVARGATRGGALSVR